MQSWFSWLQMPLLEQTPPLQMEPAQHSCEVAPQPPPTEVQGRGTETAPPGGSSGVLIMSHPDSITSVRSTGKMVICQRVDPFIALSVEPNSCFFKSKIDTMGPGVAGLMPSDGEMPHFSMVVDQARAAEQAMRSMASFAWRPSVDRAARFLELAKRVENRAKAVDDDLERTRATLVEGFTSKDLLLLSRSIDRLGYAAKSIVREMTLFQVPSLPGIKDASKACVQSSAALASALGTFYSRPRQASRVALDAQRHAKQAELICREATQELLGSPNVVDLMKTREIYRHFQEGADQALIAASIVGDALLKCAS